MDSTESFHAPNVALLDDEEKSWGQITIRRMRARRLPVRTRVLLFLAVAVGVVLLPFGLLYAFEGIESGESGLIVEPSHGVESSSTAVRPVTDLLDATPTVSSSSVSVAIISATPSATPSLSPPIRQDLPERELTPYVDPLIGTEGLGHCMTPSFRSDSSFCRRNNPVRYGQTGCRFIHTMAESSWIPPRQFHNKRTITTSRRWNGRKPITRKFSTLDIVLWGRNLGNLSRRLEFAKRPSSG